MVLTGKFDILKYCLILPKNTYNTADLLVNDVENKSNVCGYHSCFISKLTENVYFSLNKWT